MVSINSKPLQGEIWLFDPDPVKGTELGKKILPCVIISNNFLNKGPSGLVLIVPLTSMCKNIPSHIQINPPEGGVAHISFATCEQIRSITKERLVKRLGSLNGATVLNEIRSWILDLTEID
jgi:mRNA interferase MazF